MTEEELLALVDEVRRRQSELDAIEVKSGKGGVPKRLHEALSAFANRRGGGIILLGLDEARGFAVVGVSNPHRLQEEIGHVAGELEPILRPEFCVAEVEGHTIVAVTVPEVPVQDRPCYYRPATLQKGSYIRVGNTNRQMTDYEIFSYVSAREQPVFDEEPIAQATIDDLDQARLDRYLSELKRLRPRAAFLNESPGAVLRQLGVVREIGGVTRPTRAGLLVFGLYPQAFEPQLVITFLHYFGIAETEKSPRGERFLDNQKFEGAIPEMVEDVLDHILSRIRSSSLIDGLLRRDIPEYPLEALREAIVNAVAHRDYSNYARGSYIQIRLFADRLEIQSPGGLYGYVTEETLEEEQSTRNRRLMRLLEDLHLVENRGSGIRTMIQAMQVANLEPPRFQDKRSSFWVTFRNHTLMNPASIAWLNQFANLHLNDRQRLALVYLLHNDRVTNGEYQRLNHVDSATASKELRVLVQLELIHQHGTGRWTYYTLAVPATGTSRLMPQTDEERILEYVRMNGAITNKQCRVLLGITEIRGRYLLTRMTERRLLRSEGERRWRRYVLP